MFCYSNARNFIVSRAPEKPTGTTETCLQCCWLHLFERLLLSSSDRDIDKVDDLMAEITEQQEVAQEISDVISRPVGFGEDYDEVRTEDKPQEVKWDVQTSKQIEMPLCVSLLNMLRPETCSFIVILF